jgi:hypothetical protein
MNDHRVSVSHIVIGSPLRWGEMDRSGVPVRGGVAFSLGLGPCELNSVMGPSIDASVSEWVFGFECADDG